MALEVYQNTLMDRNVQTEYGWQEQISTRNQEYDVTFLVIAESLL